MRRTVFIIVFCVLAVTSGHGHCAERKEEKPKFQRHFADSLFKVGEKEIYSVEVLGGRGLKAGKNTLDFVIHDGEGHDVEGASLEVVAQLGGRTAVHAAGLKASDMGRGLYRVKDIALDVSDQWALRITIKKGDIEDAVTIELPEVE